MVFADEEKSQGIQQDEEFDDLYVLSDDVPGYKRVRRSCSLGITTFHLGGSASLQVTVVIKDVELANIPIFREKAILMPRLLTYSPCTWVRTLSKTKVPKLLYHNNTTP